LPGRYTSEWKWRSGMAVTRWSRSTWGPVSAEMGDCVRVQLPVPDIYFGM